MPGNQITFGVGFNVNESGLNKLKQSLQEIQKMTAQDAFATGNFSSFRQAQTELDKIKASVAQVQTALHNSFNANLGTTNLTRFNQELQKINLNSLASQLNQLGATGQSAFLNLTSQALALNAPLKQNYTWLTKIGQTLANTIKWNIASSAVNAFTGSIQSAYNYVRALDSSLTDIRIVTGQSREEMAQFAQQANEAAQALGRQTKDYTNAALSFYQQGLGEAEVQARTEATLKAQNVTGAGTEMADYLTAVWNGFQVSAENTEKYVDKLAAVADSSASNLSELAVGMSKVASTANAMGVDIDQLTAQLATIIATTRQAPETVGNALKTIYARINDIKTGSDEAEISLGNYTSKMAELGFSVLDADGKLKDTGTTMEEIGERWDTMTREQQIYLAQTMAGQRQMNNLIALFDNWEKYSDMLNVSLNAQGSLNEKNGRYMESLTAHMNQFKASVEGMQDALINEDDISKLYDAGSDLVNLITSFINSIGGMRGALLGVGVIGANVFKNQIAESIVTAINNLSIYKQQLEATKAQQDIIDAFKNVNINTSSESFDRARQSVIGLREEFANYKNIVNETDQQAIAGFLEQKAHIDSELLSYEELINKAVEYGNIAESLQLSHGAAGGADFKASDILNVDINTQLSQGNLTKDSEEAINSLISSLQYLNKEYNLFKSDASNLQKVVHAQKQLEQQIEKQRQTVQQLQADVNNGKTGAQEQLDAATVKLNKLETALQNSRDKVLAFRDAVQEYSSANNAFGDKTEQVNNLLAQLGQNSTTDARILTQLEQIFEELGISTEVFAKRLEEVPRRIREINEESKNLRSTVDILKQSLDTAQIGQAFSNLLRGVSSLAMGLQSLSSVTKTYKQIQDGTIDSAEGWLQIIMSLSMALPMLTSGLKNTWTGIAGLGSGLVTLGGKLAGVITSGQAASGMLGLLANSSLAASAAAGSTAASFGLALATIAPYAIAIGAVIAGVIALYKALTDESRAYKKKQEELEKGKKKYEELNSTYQDLKSTIEDYTNASNAIADLTKGTEEWKDAIQNANEEAKKLIEIWPELANKIYFDENGQAHIPESALEEATRQANADTVVQGISNVKTETELAQQGVNKVAEEMFAWAPDSIVVEAQKAMQISNFKEIWDTVGADLIQRVQQEYDESNWSISFGDALKNVLSEQFDTIIPEDLFTPDELDWFAHDLLDFEGWDRLFESFQQAEVMMQSRVARTRLALDDLNIDSDYAGLTKALMAKQFSSVTEENQQMLLDNIDQWTELTLNAATRLSESLGQNSELSNILASLLTSAEGSATLSSTMTEEQVENLRQLAKDNQSLLGKDFYRNLMNDVIPQWNEALNNATKDLHLGDAMNEMIDRIFSLDQWDMKVSPELKRSVGQMYEQVFRASGMDAVKNLNAVFGGVAPDKAEGFVTAISSISRSSSLQDLADALLNVDINAKDLNVSLPQLAEILGISLAESVAALGEKYKAAKDVVDSIAFGDGISKDDADALEAMGINLEDFFMMGAEGEQILIGDAEKLRDTVDQIQASKLYNAMQEAGQKGIELANIISELFGDPSSLEQLGTSAFQGRQVFDDTEAGSHTEYSTDWNQAQSQLDLIHAFQDQGLLGADVSTDDLTTWEKMVETHEADKVALENLAQAAGRYAEQSDLLKGKQNELAQETKNAAEALQSLRLSLDEDIDTEEWQDLTKYISDNAGALSEVSDELKTNKIAAAEVAEAILRFDDAIKDVTDNYEDWKKALDSDVAQDQAKAMSGLRDAYADMLDLDGESLSDEFLASAKNLELMKQAAEGSEEAYNQLMEAVQSDILSQVRIEPDFDLTGFEEGLNQVQAELDAMNYQELEIGANLDTGNFIAACEQMINAAGMTAQQATDYLASMGVDAEVIETSDPVTETHETGGYTATAQQLPLPYAIAHGNGTSVSVSTGTGMVSYPIYTPQVESFQTTDVKKATSLRVISANKSSGGGFKHSQASNGGGGGGNKGKKGGGGGGGNKSPKKKDPIKPLKAKIDPYHDVNIKIGDTQEALDKLGKQRNKLIGKDAVDNLTKQINLMEKEKELLKEKHGIAQEELDRQAQELANLGAIFNKNGDIANYKDLLLDKQKQVNDAIAVANGLEGDERDAYEKYVNQLKDEYKELEDAIKEYDDTKQLMDDLGADFQELIDKQIELAIEAFDLEINVKLDLKDAEKEFNDFRKKVIDQVQDDQHGGLAEAAARNYTSYYNVDNQGNVGGIIPELRQHARDVQREIQIMTNGGWSQIYGDNLAAAADDLKKYNDELMDALEEAQDTIDETHDHFLEAIDAMDEAFDTQQENLDKIDDLLTHDMEILQLIHGEENFDEMYRLWQQQINQDTLRLQALQAEQQYWKDRMNDYEEGTDEWKKAMENWQDAFEKTNEAMLTSVENLQSKWENSINSIMTKLRNTTYGGNMSAALEDWDKLTWHGDRYLDSLERANGLLDLQHSYINAINTANDPKLQQKLADLEEKQLEALSNKEHIREIDLQIAQQQLTVLQAQMALEDAQQAKTKLRLRRDSQGNYTYQYVADEDNIADKTQEYAKALADYREMVKNSLHDDLQDLSDYTQEFYDKMQEAQMKYGDDTEALMAEQERLYELYMGEDGYITRLANDAQSSMQDYQTATFTQAMGLNNLLEEDLFNKFLGPDSEMRTAVNDLLGAGGEVPTLIDSFLNDSALVAFDTISEATRDTLTGPEGILPEWQSALWTIAATYENEFVPRVVDAMNYLQQANQSYVDGLAIMQQAANRTTEQIALGLAYDTAYTNSLDEATKALLQTQDAQLSKAEQVYDSLKKNEQAFKDQSQAAIDAANALFLYWLALNGQTASGLPYSVEGKTPNIKVQTPSITSNQPSYTSSGNNGSSTSGSTSGVGSSAGNNSSSSSKQTYDYRGIPTQYTPGNSSVYQSSNRGLVRYASGGYTGEWNNSPKLALLDQKELVLNAEDTRNILDSVNIVRTIADKVSAITGAAAASMSATSAAGLMSTIGQTILQDVIINADFPAVQDAAQIKQAFNELVNLASQRASTNRRA